MRNRIYGVMLAALVGFGWAIAPTKVEAGELFVTNLDGNVHRVFEDGTKELFADVAGWANGVAFDSQSRLYVASQQEGTVWHYELDGTLLGAFATGISSPVGLTFDDEGRLYVVERSGGQVKRYAPNGDYLGVFTQIGSAFDIATDREGKINVLSRVGSVHRFDLDGTPLFQYDLPDDHGAEGLAFDSQNRLYVASQFDHDVLRYESGGSWTTIVPSISSPVGLVFDEDDELFVVGSIGNGQVEQFTAEGDPLGIYSSGHGFGLYAAFAPSSVPEPSTIAMFAGALPLLFLLAWHRRRSGRTAAA